MQQFGRALLHAASGLERRLDESLLEVRNDVLERDPFGRHLELRHVKTGRPTHMIGNQFGANAAVRRENDCTLDDILELSHVPRPVVLREQIERVWRQLEARLLILVAVLVQEVLYEQRNVVLPVAQRRQADRDHVQAVEQVFPELAVLHHLPQIEIRRGNDARINLDGVHGAEPRVLAVLDDVQKARLRVERHVADLVEEDGAPVRHVEQPLLRSDCSGEGISHVTEQRRLEELGRDGP